MPASVAIRAKNRRTVARAILDRYEAGDTIELLAEDYDWTVAEVRVLLQLDTDQWLDNLEQRLVAAEKRLRKLDTSGMPDTYRCRVQGKSQGINLALSYFHEMRPPREGR